jgi:hypothetical protein
MKRGCLLSLALYFGLAAGYYLYFRDRYEPPAPWVAALVGALVTSLGLGLLSNARQGGKDAAAIRDALAGRPRRDRELAAAIGVARPIAEPLQAPFSRVPCIAYDYEAYRMVTSSGKNRTTSKRMERSGFALTPSVVAGPTGEVRLLGFPMLDEFPKRTIDDPQGRQAALDYLATAEPMSMEGFSPGKMLHEIKDVLTDDDGAVRKDWRITADERLGECTLTETHVPVDAEVTALGMWSQEKGGLVPDLGRGMVNRMYPGRGDAVLAGRRKSAVFSVIAGILLLAVTQAALWLLLERRHSFYAPQRQQALNDAARDGDLGKLQGLVRRGADLDAQAPDGVTPLIVADEAATGFLLAHGASTEARSKDGDTPLMVAARRGDTAKARALIAAGARLDATRPRETDTALAQALDAERYEVAELLLAAGAQDDRISQASGGEPVAAADPSGPFAACLEFLRAVQAEDRPTIRRLRPDLHEAFVAGIDLAAWKGARPAAPELVEGWRRGEEATLTVRGMTGGGFVATWTYQMRRAGGDWKVARERWLTRSGEAPEVEGDAGTAP